MPDTMSGASGGGGGGFSLPAIVAVASPKVWSCWVCWDYGGDSCYCEDEVCHCGTPTINAVFPTELEAHKHVQETGHFMRVRRLEAGDVASQLRTDRDA